MKPWRLVVSVALVLFGCHAAAQEATPAATQVPVTVEYYYRIKWGSADQFTNLYDRNHAPLLQEMKKLGFIRSIRVDEPFTHLAGGPR